MKHFGFESVAGLVRADTLAQRYHVRPSDLLLGSYEAWCLDEAAAVAGSVAEEKRRRAEGLGEPGAPHQPQIPRPISIPGQEGKLISGPIPFVGGGKYVPPSKD